MVPPAGGERNPKTESAATTAKRVVPSSSGGRKFYSGAIKDVKKFKRFQLTVKSTSNQSTEMIKELLKTKINPTEIKVEINKSKCLKKWSLLMETNIKEEIGKSKTK